MAKKPSWHHVNYPALKELLEDMQLSTRSSMNTISVLWVLHILLIYGLQELVYHRHAGETSKRRILIVEMLHIRNPNLPNT